jgi:hypothetical protein
LFQAIGINLFIGLYDGCVEKDPVDGAILPALRFYGMPVICDQATGLAGPNGSEHLTDHIIVGWNQTDEPDNAQWIAATQSYGPCIDPSAIVQLYNQYRAADPNRPVFLGLGQGVGFDADNPYVGRGYDCNENAGRGLADYPRYIEGADIISNDSYPLNNHVPLWWVGRSVDRLREWSGYRKAVWTWIETTNIDPASGNGTPTPADIRSEVWMAVIHGARGFGYFVHQFSPTFEEDSVLFPEHADAKNAMIAINAQVTSLARVLNTPSVANGVTVFSSNANSPIDWMLKRYGGSTFLFAMGGKDGGATTGSFRLRDFPDRAVAAVLGEDRRILIKHGEFQDHFDQYEVHIYEVLYDPTSKVRIGAPAPIEQ